MPPFTIVSNATDRLRPAGVEAFLLAAGRMCSEDFLGAEGFLAADGFLATEELLTAERFL